MRNILFIVGVLTSFSSIAFAPSEQFSDIQYNNLVTDTDGYISNTTSDGHFVLNNIKLNRSQMCGLKLNLEFRQAPQKASTFDVYWRTAQAGFSEAQKAFFIINQDDAAAKNSYIIDMCKLFNFSGNFNNSLQQANIISLRLDYPPNKDLSIRIDDIQFLSAAAVAQKDAAMIALEPYERVARESFTSMDVVTPKLIFAFEEGLKRFSSDLPFLIFWLMLIFVLKLVILLSFVRQFKTDDDSAWHQK